MLVNIVNGDKDISTYKAVQIHVDGLPFLVLGSDDSKHSSILEYFLEKKHVEYDWIQSRTKPLKIPALSGQYYKVAGMGLIEMHFEEKTYGKLHGKSQDYNIGIDEAQRRLVQKQLRLDGWKPI